MAKVIKALEQKNMGKKKKRHTPKHKNKDYKGVSFLSKSYTQRQFIVVVDEKLVKAEDKIKEKETGATEGKGIEWTRTIIKTLYSIVPATYVLVDAIETTIKGISKLRSKGIGVTLVSRSDAKKLTFPPGHPQDKVIYVGNPTKPT